MKRIGLFLLVFALAAPLMAQDDDVKQQPQPQPDFSRNKLIQIFASEEPRETPPKKADFGIGYIDFRALNMRWHIGYLPFFAPLYGSMPWAMNGAFGGMPDGMTLTGTEYPQTPQTWARRRALNAELKRIERTERAREKSKPNATVTAKPE